MEDIFSIGEKWIRSVASSSFRTRIASGRPEVPARAAAAAAVARKIATLAPQDRLLLPDGSGSIFAARPRGETAEELEEAFYEDKFDPVRYMLEHIPAENVNLGYFDGKVILRCMIEFLLPSALSCEVHYIDGPGFLQ